MQQRRQVELPRDRTEPTRASPLLLQLTPVREHFGKVSLVLSTAWLQRAAAASHSTRSRAPGVVCLLVS